MVQRTNNPFLQSLDRGRTQRGSGFTNLQRILQANVGNRLGGAIQSGVSGEATGVRQRAEKARDEFEAEAEKKRIDTPQSSQMREDVISRVQAGGEPTEQEYTKFSQFAAGKYGGPKTLAGAEDLRRQARDVTTLGRAVRDPGQRMGLLQRFLGGRDYTVGEQRLDELLLGQQPGSLRDIRRAAFGTERDVDVQRRAAEQQGQELERRAKAFGEETVGQLEAAAEPTLGTLEDQVKTAQEEEARKALSLQQIRQALTYQPITDAQGNVLEELPLYGPDASVYKNATGQFFAEDPVARFSPAHRYAMERLTQENLVDDSLIQQFQKMKEEGASVGYNPTGQGPDVASSIDVNPLIADRLLLKEAQNVDLAGMASPEQAAKLNILSRLAGREQAFDPEQIGGYAPSQVQAKMLSDIRRQIDTANEETQRNWDFMNPPPVAQDTCFAPGTMIRMADNTYKPVEQLRLMDEVYYGGKVLGTGQTLNEGLYNYNGVQVSGTHAILENGVWVRVEDSWYGEKIHNEIAVVYPVFTERNILITENNVWADFAECPDSGNQTEAGRLEALNSREDNDILHALDKELKVKIA